MPRTMYVEAFRTLTGAIVGDRIDCVIEGVPRAYTVMPAPPGKGKGTSIRRAYSFFDVTLNGDRMRPPLLFKWGESTWRRTCIGEEVAHGSSMPGMMRSVQMASSHAEAARLIGLTVRTRGVTTAWLHSTARSTCILGRKTYDFAVRFGLAERYAGKKNYVFSRTLSKAARPKVSVVSRDVTTFTERFRSEKGRDIWLVGRAELVAAFLDSGRWMSS